MSLICCALQVADAQPRGAYTGESPLRADCQSSVGPGGSAAGLGGHVPGGIPRRNSYASSDAFGGHLSLGSVAGSEELAPPRTALPPLSALPRISREGTCTLICVQVSSESMIIVSPLWRVATAQVVLLYAHWLFVKFNDDFVRKLQLISAVKESVGVQILQVC